MQERSAEWLRGRVSVLTQLSGYRDWDLSSPRTRGARPEAPPISECESPIDVFLSESKRLLADAEAREGGEKKDVPETNFGDMPTAAEVIEAAEKALAHWKSHVSMPTGPTANYGAILESLAVSKIETDAALVLCARWKEARNAELAEVKRQAAQRLREAK